MTGRECTDFRSLYSSITSSWKVTLYQSVHDYSVFLCAIRIVLSLSHPQKTLKVNNKIDQTIHCKTNILHIYPKSYYIHTLFRYFCIRLLRNCDYSRGRIIRHCICFYHRKSILWRHTGIRNSTRNHLVRHFFGHDW